MISAWLAEQAARQPRQPLLCDADAILEYGAVQSRVAELARELAVPPGAHVGLAAGRLTDTRWALLHLLALDRCGARPYLLTSEAAAHPDWLARLGPDRLLTPGAVVQDLRPEPPPAPASPGEVVLCTSGTTGLPKAALHTWSSVAAQVRVQPELQAARWLLTYPLSSYAGLQVVLHALRNGGPLTLAPPGWQAVARLARRDQVTHVSATPTFYRFLLASVPAPTLAEIPLRQITLGGEPVDQPVLDRLRSTFPAARLTHIYASTEMGVCFSVQDGRAGFPERYLGDPALPVGLRIEDGELRIRSPHAMRQYLGREPLAEEGWYTTGDFVEVREGRVHFLGRRSERINVGGQKVYPTEVEGVILGVPGVQAVRVTGAASSLAGQLVRAEVVPVAGAEPVALRTAIAARCRDALPPYKRPRLIELVAELAQTASGKMTRR